MVTPAHIKVFTMICHGKTVGRAKRKLWYAHTSQKPLDISATTIATLAAPAMYNAR
jgi:hypothetical protein